MPEQLLLACGINFCHQLGIERNLEGHVRDEGFDHFKGKLLPERERKEMEGKKEEGQEEEEEEEEEKNEDAEKESGAHADSLYIPASGRRGGSGGSSRSTRRRGRKRAQAGGGRGGSSSSRTGEMCRSMISVPVNVDLSGCGGGEYSMRGGGGGGGGGEGIKQVAAGANHSVLLSSQGHLYRWGYDNGRVYKRPSRLTMGIPLSCCSISCGRKHTLALMEGGFVMSWGTGYFGQLGHGDNVSYSHPRMIHRLDPERLGDRIIQVGCGGYHSGALTEAGMMFAWGFNRHGQVGNGLKENTVSEPLLVSRDNFRASSIACKIAMGRHHSSVLTTKGELYTWGSCNFGKLGLADQGATKVITIPTEVPTFNTHPLFDVASGDFHMVGLTRMWEVYAWGYGAEGQCGHGSALHLRTPRKVERLAGKDIRKITCGGWWSMAVDAEGYAYSWGCADGGWTGLDRPQGDAPFVEVGPASSIAKRGTSTTTTQAFDSCHNALFPEPVEALKPFRITQLSCGGAHTLFVGSMRKAAGGGGGGGGGDRGGGDGGSSSSGRSGMSDTSCSKSSSGGSGSSSSTTTSSSSSSSSSSNSSSSSMSVRKGREPAVPLNRSSSSSNNNDRTSTVVRTSSTPDSAPLIGPARPPRDRRPRPFNSPPLSGGGARGVGPLGGGGDGEVDFKALARGSFKGPAAAVAAVTVDDTLAGAVATVTAGEGGRGGRGQERRGSERSKMSGRGEVLQNEEESKIFSACRHARLEEVRMALQTGKADVTLQDERGNTLLNTAAQNGHQAIARMLVKEFHAPLETPNHKGNTPLHFCFSYRHDELRDFLLQRGARDTLLNQDGLTPHEGISRAHFEAST